MSKYLLPILILLLTQTSSGRLRERDMAFRNFDHEWKGCSSNEANAQIRAYREVFQSRKDCVGLYLPVPTSEWQCMELQNRPRNCKGFYLACKRSYQCLRANQFHNRSTVKRGLNSEQFLGYYDKSGTKLPFIEPQASWIKTVMDEAKALKAEFESELKAEAEGGICPGYPRHLRDCKQYYCEYTNSFGYEGWENIIGVTGGKCRILVGSNNPKFYYQCLHDPKELKTLSKTWRKAMKGDIYSQKKLSDHFVDGTCELKEEID